MSVTVIAPVVPSAPALGSSSPDMPATAVRAQRRPPLARLVPSRDRTTVYGFAAVDERGRIADQHVVRALGWTPGTRLDIQETNGLILIAANPQGVFSVTSQGHLRLLAPVRHWCRLVPGDRVLLAADPCMARLVVYPPAALDAMLAQYDPAVSDGAR